MSQQLCSPRRSPDVSRRDMKTYIHTKEGPTGRKETKLTRQGSCRARDSSSPTKLNEMWIPATTRMNLRIPWLSQSQMQKITQQMTWLAGIIQKRQICRDGRRIPGAQERGWADRKGSEGGWRFLGGGAGNGLKPRCGDGHTTLQMY